MAGKVVHFEIPIDDSERGVAFYSAAFGWELSRWGPIDYWTTEAGEGEGIGGALTTRSEESPSPTFFVEVDDLGAALEAIVAAGGHRRSEPMPIPGVGWFARFEDTEGNLVGVFQADPDAPMPAGMAET